MQHVVIDSDKQALYALALADGDVDMLRAMLRPDDASKFDLEKVLRRLERDYASVHADRARLHDDPAMFVRAYLKEDLRRTSENVQQMIASAVETLSRRQKELEGEVKLVEDRYEDSNWCQMVLTMTQFQLWLDESQAWRWIMPRVVEALAYNPSLVHSLVKIINGWRNNLSEASERMLHVLEEATNEIGPLLTVLTQVPGARLVVGYTC